MQEALPPELSNEPPVGHDFGAFGKALLATCKVLALIGGVIFVALVIMSIVSIVGRKLASAPVPGDVEVLQMCAAFACACFFAYCHITHSDVKVDFFTTKLSHKTNARLDAFGSLLVGIFGTLIAWRSTVGAFSLKEAGETSTILAWPLWIAQLLMTPGFVLLAIVGFYMAWYQLTRKVPA
jgi:TRAP-type C4-dicarboxylate transport system permease small subunit